MRGVGDPETLLDGGGGKATVSGCDFSRGPAAPLCVQQKQRLSSASLSGSRRGRLPPVCMHLPPLPAEPWMQGKQPQQDTRRHWRATSSYAGCPMHPQCSLHLSLWLGYPDLLKQNLNFRKTLGRLHVPPLVTRGPGALCHSALPVKAVNSSQHLWVR